MTQKFEIRRDGHVIQSGSFAECWSYLTTSFPDVTLGALAPNAIELVEVVEDEQSDAGEPQCGDLSQDTRAVDDGDTDANASGDTDSDPEPNAAA